MSAGELAPCRGITKADWTPNVQQSKTETLSGATDTIALGVSFWSIDFEVECPTRADFDEWSIFLAERDGSDLSFTIPRTYRKRPGDASITSDAGLDLVSVSKASRTVTFEVPDGGSAKAGDMISYRTAGDGYFIGVVREDASPSGGNVTMKVWPEPMTPHPTTPAPRRIEALGEFKIDGEPRWSESNRRRSIRFKARQVIR